jgi:sugar lactone lactonase YvrE
MGSIDLPATESQAARALPRDDLDRHEAARLLSAVFGDPTSEGELPDLDDAHFLSTTQAVIPPEAAPSSVEVKVAANAEPAAADGAGTRGVMIESTLPLRAVDADGNWGPVELALEQEGDSLAPANPLAALRIPMQLGGDIQLPEPGVNVHLVGAPEDRAPSLLGSSTAFYPNVAADTDLTVAPTATGFETKTQLRTAEAPREQELRLDMPAGAHVEATKEGGAMVREGEDLLLTVEPPVAEDADGNEVPVSLEVRGDVLVIRVAPAEGAAFPVLVDPVFESYNWQNWYETQKLPNAYVPPMPDWHSWSTTAAFVPEEHTRGESGGRRGIVIGSGWPGTVVNGSSAHWEYVVPRFYSDYEQTGVRPTTYINKVTLEGLNYRLPLFNGNPPSRRHSPFFVGGIWDMVNGVWISQAYRNGIEGQIIDYNPPAFNNPNANRGAKTFGIVLASEEDGANPERHLWAERATIELADPEPPELTEVKDPTVWVNDKPTARLTFSAKDQGIGVSKLTLQQPVVTGSSTTLETKQGCTGGASKPCPRLWTDSTAGSPQLNYDPSLMPQGYNVLKVAAWDAVGHKSGEGTSYPYSEPLLKVDHQKPRLTLSGTATEQETLGNTRPQYVIRYTGNDGGQTPLLSSEEPPEAQSSFGSAGSTEGKFSHPAGLAVQEDGSVWVVDTGNNRVQKFNAKGEYLSKVGSAGTATGQFTRPTAVAVDGSGNVWVTDAGNRRVQKFNSAGQFVSSFGSAGTGPGQFAGSGPEGIAIDRKGNIWVADTYGARVQVFSPAGEFIRSVGTAGSGPKQMREPTGLDLGPHGNIWIADWANNKVMVYAEDGTFVREFGAYGTADSQFVHPDAISADSKGQVWIADQSGRVQAFTEAGSFITKFGSQGTGPRQFSLSYPIGIASDNRGALFVADTQNNRVQRWKVPNYAPEYASVVGSSGAAAGQLNNPGATAVDSAGNVWVLDFANNRVQKFSSAGKFILQFGSAGTAAGQFSTPIGMTVDSKGNVWVVDYGNKRVEKFSSTGAYLLQYAFGEGVYYPTDVAADTAGNVWVSTWGGIKKINESGQLVASINGCPSGGQSWIDLDAEGNIWMTCETFLLVVKPNGEVVKRIELGAAGEDRLVQPTGLDVDSKGFVWMTNKGSSRVKEYNSAGEYVTQFGSPGSGTGQFAMAPSGELAAPDVVTDGKGGIWVSDPGNDRLQRWATPVANQSGVASGTIEVDNQLVKTDAPGCLSQNCALTREWILRSDEYSPGVHTVKVKATDGVGLVTEKQMSVNIARDTTSPQLTVTGALKQAPEGWIEQKPYTMTAVATDVGGYGVKQIQLKIDGTVASQTVATTCASGGCQKTKEFSVDGSAYSGGAHQLEVVATDGAGNVAVDKWTMNVDPEGTIPAAEAEDTLEALEETSPTNAVGPSSNESAYQGSVAGLKLRETETGLASAGSALAPTYVPSSPTQGFTIEVATPGLYEAPCSDEAIVEPGSQLTAEEEEEIVAMQAHCVPATYPEEGLIPVTVTPTQVGSGAGSTALSGADSAGVTPNLQGQVDLVTRPLYDGAMTFASIRDAIGPETYSWSVDLAGNQTMKLIDPKHVEVFFEDGRAAFGIAATPAHDAVGTAVPTSLSISSGSIVTLTVQHRSGSYVYPVIGGAGWEGGVQTSYVEMPPPEPLPGEDEAEEPGTEREEEFEAFSETEGRFTTKSQGPPVYLRSTDLPSRAYRFNECHWDLYGLPEARGPGTKIPPIERRPEIVKQCHNPKDPQPGQHVISWADVIYGRFWYDWGKKVEIRAKPQCNEWGPRAPARIDCFADRWVATGTQKVNVLGRWRFPAGAYGIGIQGFLAGCQELNGVLPTRPQPSAENGERVYWENYHEYREGVWPKDDDKYPTGQHCDWGSLETKVR